jgi:hypothetical protein
VVDTAEGVGYGTPHSGALGEGDDGGSAMAKGSKATAKRGEFPAAVDYACELDGYTVNFVETTKDRDLAPMLSVLPGGLCQCPHWGLVTKGQMTVRYADHEELLEAGDAFYMPPGHTSSSVAGTEWLQFSPTDLLAETKAALDAAQKH